MLLEIENSTFIHCSTILHIAQFCFTWGFGKTLKTGPNLKLAHYIVYPANFGNHCSDLFESTGSLPRQLFWKKNKNADIADSANFQKLCEIIYTHLIQRCI